jgi:hypothetical protein
MALVVDQFIQVAPDSTGKLLDNSQLTVSGNTVNRERINVSDPQDPVAHASVLQRTPLTSEYGVAVAAVADPQILSLLQQLLDEFREFKQTFYAKL